MPPAPIPRIELASAPTPLLKLERLSAELGCELWVKRDDLTGLLESGAKIRKLEFVIGEALAQNADTLITCGTLQSSACRAVAAVAARLGLRAVLALRGTAPAASEGNLLLARLLGADVRYCDERAWAAIDTHLQDFAAEARRAGRTPYVIPEGAATVAGALGYLVCGQELAQQVHHGAPEFDSIVLPAFTGGSHAGLVMAAQLTGLRAEIVSVPVRTPVRAVPDTVAAVVGEARVRYGLDVTPPKDVRVLDAPDGDGETPTREDLAVVARVARLEGLVLDPRSTARAFRALLDHLARAPASLGRRICFVQTAGVLDAVPFQGALGALLDETPLVES